MPDSTSHRESSSDFDLNIDNTVGSDLNPLLVARLLLAIASLHVDENEAHDWVLGFGDVSVACCHAKKEELVYDHPP